MSDTSVSYVIAKDGSSNWDFLSEGKSEGADESPNDEKTSASVDLSVESIVVSNAQFVMENNQSNTSFKVSNFNAQLNNVNLTKEAIDVAVDGDVSYSGFPELSIMLESKIFLNLESSEFRLSESSFSVDKNNEDLAKLDFDTKLELDSSRVSGNYSLEVGQLRKVMSLFDIELPAEVPNKAINTLSISLGFDLRFEQDIDLSLNKLKMDLDSTQLQGDGNILLQEQAPLPKLTLALNSQHINLDEFYKLDSSDAGGENGDGNAADTVTNTADAEEAPPVELPIELLKQLDANLALEFDLLTYQSIDMKDFVFKLSANDGEINLEIPKCRS